MISPKSHLSLDALQKKKQFFSIFRSSKTRTDIDRIHDIEVIDACNRVSLSP